QFPNFDPRIGLPEDDARISAAGGETSAIRAEGNRQHRAKVPTLQSGSQRLQVFAVFSVPQPHCAVLAGSRQQTTIRAKGDIGDFTGMAAQQINLCARLNVPYAYGVV